MIAPASARSAESPPRRACAPAPVKGRLATRRPSRAARAGRRQRDDGSGGRCAAPHRLPEGAGAGRRDRQHARQCAGEALRGPARQARRASGVSSARSENVESPRKRARRCEIALHASREAQMLRCRNAAASSMRGAAPPTHRPPAMARSPSPAMPATRRRRRILPISTRAGRRRWWTSPARMSPSASRVPADGSSMQPATLALIRDGGAEKGRRAGRRADRGDPGGQAHRRSHPALPSAAADATCGASSRFDAEGRGRRASR